ncbi:MAG: LD-carboxypeptidase [Bacteroidales bacterium]|nr:LD-carboxypeptidase [Bacteroidales bacterium]
MNKRAFSIRIMLVILSFILLVPVVKAAGPKKPLKCVAPAYLKPGDKVALISPSYYCSMETALAAVDTLRSWGYEPVIGPNVGKKFLEHYAGTVEERLADLRWALNDPDIKAILCLRGGYSTLHLVEGLPLKELVASPKWLIGYSDITTLLSMETCAGVMSIHGVMGCNIAKQYSVNVQQSCTLLRNLLQGQVPRYELPAHKENILGRAKGTLVGGNLATFAPLLCSQVNEIGQSDIILFVEEVEETHHNIDRLFNMLKMSGVLAHCKGIILGDFTDCKNDVGYESVEAMLRQYIEPYHIPLLCGFPAGHEKLNLPLVIGAPVTMEVRADSATLTFDIPGVQKMVRTEGLRKQPMTAQDVSEIMTIQESKFSEWQNIKPSKDTILVRLYWKLAKEELLDFSLDDLKRTIHSVCPENGRFELTYWDYYIEDESSYLAARRGTFLCQQMDSICPNSISKITIKQETIARHTEEQPGYKVLMICPVRK